ncbi:putative Nucleosome binding protein [Taphrina deformans PYCC 5710]|uniref:Nucleosome binding protein n=1 Tax=Taphrina deformans (strain PYCC 5710 / ATCC 11124 / CBS 356.35 / IMI 108563 / JCM 9778 / NBRC 8474) TaxID=1097556 RepID=R4XD00_TAPDE|nr:putative Nucleosome binding protein [Taphrina deformans PYCC 5710]|eukprot:CCG82288.1 putative Nucleosome binding protein [Taphrina deformans PYCC 5710]
MPKDTKPRTVKRDVTKRAKKDPDAPKRALSSYMLFAQDQRSVVQQEHPNIAFGEVGKVLGQKWKALTDSEKKPYEDRAAEEKKKYEKAKAQYEVENPKAGKTKGAAKKTAKKSKSDDDESA